MMVIMTAVAALGAGIQFYVCALTEINQAFFSRLY